MRRLAAILALALAAGGCATGSRAPDRAPPAGHSASRRDDSRRPAFGRAEDAGVRVVLRKDGSLTLYNREISRERLVRRLVKEENCDKGARAVMLEAGPGVDVADLGAMREYLVRNRIPRVVLVTRATVSAETSAFPGAPPPHLP